MKQLVLLVCLVLWCLTYDFIKNTGDIPIVLAIGDILSLMICSIMIKTKDMETTNKITINGITVPDGTDVKTAVENGNLVITFSKESEVKEPKFKGDFLNIYCYGIPYVAILNRIDDDFVYLYASVNIVDYKVDISVLGELCFIRKHITAIKQANQEDRRKLSNELAKQKKLHWDSSLNKFEPIRWRAEKGGKFWYINSIGSVCYGKDNRYNPDNIRFYIRNYFQTEELANKALPKWKEFFKSLSL